MLARRSFSIRSSGDSSAMPFLVSYEGSLNSACDCARDGLRFLKRRNRFLNEFVRVRSEDIESVESTRLPLTLTSLDVAIPAAAKTLRELLLNEMDTARTLSLILDLGGSMALFERCLVFCVDSICLLGSLFFTTMDPARTRAGFPPPAGSSGWRTLESSSSGNTRGGIWDCDVSGVVCAAKSMCCIRWVCMMKAAPCCCEFLCPWMRAFVASFLITAMGSGDVLPVTRKPHRRSKRRTRHAIPRVVPVSTRCTNELFRWEPSSLLTFPRPHSQQHRDTTSKPHATATTQKHRKSCSHASTSTHVFLPAQ
jgi:hypothetical protein